jgi:methylase of polypeptide subunit release factors
MIDNFIRYLNKKNYTNPSIIFDIGSRDCLQSLEFAKQYPSAKIFAFECNPLTLPLCKKKYI